MTNSLRLFERMTRNSKNVGDSIKDETAQVHPFDERNIHPDIASVSLNLFDNGHYSQATFGNYALDLASAL